MNYLTKVFFTTVSLFFLAISVSCSNGDDTNAKDILGIYKVTDRTCKGSEVEVEACEAIAFIELVKGNFYQISDNEVAFVVWSGEKGEDLTYTARKYEGSIAPTKEQVRVLINDDGYVREEISFSGKTASYSYQKLQPGEPLTSQLTLKKAAPSDLAGYHMEYPGNN